MRGPSWGHPNVVLGAILSFFEPFCGHLSPKIDKVSLKLTFEYPHEGPCVDWWLGHQEPLGYPKEQPYVHSGVRRGSATENLL